MNAYGSSSLADGRNVMLYTYDANDKAQQWRAMYAGKYGEHTLYWLNCLLNEIEGPYALDRFTGTLRNNADVYMAETSSAQDQLVYFTEVSWTGAFYIHLYDLYNSESASSDLVLTAAPNPDGVNGNNSPTSLTQAGNVYWAKLIEGNVAQQWIISDVVDKDNGSEPKFNDMVTNFPYDKYYLNDKDSSYPSYVGECVWYCKGRFYEVNGIANCCKGHAYEWETSIHLAGGLERDVGQNGEIELRPRSVAVFGKNTVYTLGHVVFIEEVDGENIAYSHCNCTKIGEIIRISNGEIEVPNPIVPLNKAQDGAKLYSNKNDFPTLFGSGLKAIIYKKPEET